MDVNQIRFGDCLRVMRRIPNGTIDMVYTDMPFGTTKNKWDTVINLVAWWKEIKRVCKPNAAILLTAQVPFNIILGGSNVGWLRYEWIYKKTLPTGFQNANKMPMKSHENVMVFYNKLPTYNPIKTFGHSLKEAKRTKQSSNYGLIGCGNYSSTERYPLSVQEFKSDRQKSCINSTQKPVVMNEYFIKTYSNEGDTVLDTCGGSGSTAIACINIKRNFIVIENDKVQFLSSVDRLKRHYGR